MTYSLFNYDLNQLLTPLLVDSRVSDIQTRVTSTYSVIVLQPRSNHVVPHQENIYCSDDDEAARVFYQSFFPDIADATCFTL